MKNSLYSPDEFMASLYSRRCNSPYDGAATKEDVIKTGEWIKEKTEQMFNISALPVKGNSVLKPVGKPLVYPEYTLQKYSVEICDNLHMLVYFLVPKSIKSNAPGVVALCGHGYGVRQILGISKSGRKKKLRYIDNYQKNFAVELAKRGCVVAAPELFGFGEARLKKDLIKPFYISSCDELSHHLLPYGLTTASLRIYQAVFCADLLLKRDDVDAERLGCMGISGGGLTALYAGLIDGRFRRIVVSGYVNSFKDSIMSVWHCPDNYIPGIMNIGEIYDFAAALAPRELLIESGEKDRIFPIEASRKAHEHIKRIYSVAGAADKLHIDVFDGKHSVNGKKSFDFLAE